MFALILFCFIFTDYVSYDNNYRFTIPDSWHIISSRNVPVDITLVKNIKTPLENMTITTMGKGLEDNVYQNRNKIISQLKDNLPKFTLKNATRSNIKGSSNSLYIECEFQQGKTYYFLKQYIFLMNNIGYNLSVTGLKKDNGELSLLFEDLVMSFKKN